MKKNNYNTISIIVLLFAIMLMLCSCAERNPFLEVNENAIVVDKSGDFGIKWIKIRRPHAVKIVKYNISKHDWETLNLGDTIKIQE